MNLDFLNGMSDVDIAFINQDEMAGILGEIAKAMASKDEVAKSKAKQSLNRIANAQQKKEGSFVNVRPQDTKDMTAKALFEKRLNQIPDEARRALIEGSQTTGDFWIFAVALAAGKNKIELFRSAMTNSDGVANIDRSHLPNNATMLVTSIIMLSGVGAGATEADGAIVNFGKIHEIIANSTFTFRNGQKTFFENVSNTVFNHSGTAGLLPGEYKLETPKIILPSTDITFDIKAPSGIVANTFIKVVLGGVTTIKS